MSPTPTATWSMHRKNFVAGSVRHLHSRLDDSSGLVRLRPGDPALLLPGPDGLRVGVFTDTGLRFVDESDNESPEQPILSFANRRFSIAQAADRSLMVGSETSSRSVTLRDETGHVLRTITPRGGDIVGLALSSDRTRLALTLSRERGHSIAVYDTASGKNAPLRRSPGRSLRPGLQPGWQATGRRRRKLRRVRLGRRDGAAACRVPRAHVQGSVHHLSGGRVAAAHGFARRHGSSVGYTNRPRSRATLRPAHGRRLRGGLQPGRAADRLGWPRPHGPALAGVRPAGSGRAARPFRGSHRVSVRA